MPGVEKRAILWSPSGRISRAKGRDHHAACRPCRRGAGIYASRLAGRDAAGAWHRDARRGSAPIPAANRAASVPALSPGAEPSLGRPGRASRAEFSPPPPNAPSRRCSPPSPCSCASRDPQALPEQPVFSADDPPLPSHDLQADHARQPLPRDDDARPEEGPASAPRLASSRLGASSSSHCASPQGLIARFATCRTDILGSDDFR